jgi:hypothetical protein
MAARPPSVIAMPSTGWNSGLKVLSAGSKTKALYSGATCAFGSASRWACRARWLRHGGVDRRYCDQLTRM